MYRTILTLALGFTTLTITIHADNDNPLENYEQVEPAAVMDLPAVTATTYPSGDVERGRYLAELLGCGSCHTDGALVGKPDASRLMAGSQVGIATSNPLAEKNPGVVYPANITSDHETGIGDWTLDEIATLLQSGIGRHGSQAMPVMPWLTYSRLLPDDAIAIAMYLKSLSPVNHQVPATVQPGQHATAPFIHFGVYRSRQP